MTDGTVEDHEATEGMVEDSSMEPYQLTILSKKFDAITVDMTQTLLKSARSNIISVARDFSSAITLADGREFEMDAGLPIHLANTGFIPRHTLEVFDDIEEGDCFLTNSPYAGNTHHADYTLHVPVFYEGELLFWTISRAHLSDIGAPNPSTYVMDGETLYEEGPHFPSVRVQSDYEDRDDVVRTCKLNIRAGDTQWYGDFRAQVASVRAGEEGIHELCEEYGVETVKAFAEAWIEYGEEMIRDEISDFPEAEVAHTSYHDPIPGAPDGVPVTVTLSFDPDDERIHVDLTDNMETVPSGFNLPEASTVAAVYTGIFNNLDPDVPANHGSISRIDIEMDEGKIVGKPDFPVGTSVGNTNIADVLINATQAAFADLGEPHGVAEGATGMTPVVSNIYGTDFRRDDEPFVNQTMYFGGGGPGVYGHDGWMLYGIAVCGGWIYRNSIELDERQYPILIERNALIEDSEGPGTWRGAPGCIVEYGPREDPITVSYLGNACEFPPQGILGGGAGSTADAYMFSQDGERIDLPHIADGPIELSPGETIVGELSGGGGYGPPENRDPEAVLHDVREGLISEERAREVYGVAVDGEAFDLAVDTAATERLREEMEADR